MILVDNVFSIDFKASALQLYATVNLFIYSFQMLWIEYLE